MVNSKKPTIYKIFPEYLIYCKGKKEIKLCRISGSHGGDDDDDDDDLVNGKCKCVDLFFWAATTCALVARHQPFGETYCLHLQGYESYECPRRHNTEHRYIHYRENLKTHKFKYIYSLHN
jgi:hypothetical protein